MIRVFQTSRRVSSSTWEWIFTFWHVPCQISGLFLLAACSWKWDQKLKCHLLLDTDYKLSWRIFLLIYFVQLWKTARKHLQCCLINWRVLVIFIFPKGRGSPFGNFSSAFSMVSFQIADTSLVSRCPDVFFSYHGSAWWDSLLCGVDMYTNSKIPPEF